jgi:hypothetical protein
VKWNSWIFIWESLKRGMDCFGVSSFLSDYYSNITEAWAGWRKYERKIVRGPSRKLQPLRASLRCQRHRHHRRHHYDWPIRIDIFTPLAYYCTVRLTAIIAYLHGWTGRADEVAWSLFSFQKKKLSSLALTGFVILRAIWILVLRRDCSPGLECPSSIHPSCFA